MDKKIDDIIFFFDHNKDLSVETLNTLIEQILDLIINISNNTKGNEESINRLKVFLDKLYQRKFS